MSCIANFYCQYRRLTQTSLIQAAGLEVVHEVLETEALLIANPNSTHKHLVELIKKRIEGFITATKYCLVMYNISEDLLPKALEISPGKKSPTITNLEAKGMKAVSSLVLMKEVSEKMDALHDIGATDILVLNLENSRM